MHMYTQNYVHAITEWKVEKKSTI